MLIKISSILLLFLGESMAIYAEVIAARLYGGNTFWAIFWKGLIIITLAGGFLVMGYMLGYKGFKSIWVVSVISVVSIIIIEPVVNYFVFKELPTAGTSVGFAFAALGLLSMVLL